ncbi:MAG: NUDIX hydrolase [Chlamydiota bacterium]
MDETAIAAIFNAKRTHILLIKRRDVPVWVLPGGGIEPGESPENACIREAYEETGYTIHLLRKVGEYSPANRLTRFTHIYEGVVASGKASLSEETAAVRFFPVNDLPPLMPPPYTTWVAEAEKNFPFVIQRRLSEISYTLLLYRGLTNPILVMRFLLTKLGLTWNS